jgi:pSer/pThr/pTyr-binding forkhead associated (FHA) protein
LTIPSGLVSRQHARFVVGRSGATLVDLGSKNGTLVHGRRIEGETRLNDGDEIRIGPALLVFCAPGAGSTRTRRSSPA